MEEHIRQMLLLGRKAIDRHPALIAETGAVNVKGDNTLQMDVKTEEIMIDYIKKNNLPANIFSEEIGLVEFHPQPKYTIAFDPLDGSTNYKLGKNYFPYGFIVAAYEGLNPRLNDVVAAGAIEYSRNLSWIYNGIKTCSFDGKPVALRNDWKIDRHLPVYLDLYYKKAYEKYQPLPEKVFIRNTGSTIGNLSYVLENTAAVIGHICMRPEEAGAVVALLKGAGGLVVDHRGRDLGEELFSPDRTYEILGGSRDVVNFCVSNLR